MNRKWIGFTLFASFALLLSASVPIALNAQDPQGRPFWSVTGNQGTNSSQNFLGTTDNQPLVLKTNGTERLRVDTSGNVGIGTINPIAPLHIADGALFLEDDFGDIWFKEVADLSAYVTAGVPSPTDPIFRVFAPPFGASGWPRMSILANGNVGIGTADPSRRLDVDGFIKQTNGHMLFKDGTGNAVFVLEDGAGPNRFVFRSVPDLDAYDAGPPITLDMMTIENTGHVGIGTTDPNSKLEVSDGYIELDTSAGTPPASDCDAPDEVGRMKVDSANTNLYVCTATGWVTK